MSTTLVKLAFIYFIRLWRTFLIIHPVKKFPALIKFKQFLYLQEPQSKSFETSPHP
jgi:hypothetical protein